jgi:hypothetical protein
MSADMLLLGTKFPAVHKFMDMYQPILQSKHRLLNHNAETIKVVTKRTGSKLAGWSAYYHILLDRISDEVGQEDALYELCRGIRNGEYPSPFAMRRKKHGKR